MVAESHYKAVRDIAVWHIDVIINGRQIHDKDIRLRALIGMKADVFVLYYYCQGKTLKTLAHWFQHVYRTVIVVYIVSKDVSRTAQRAAYGLQRIISRA